MASINKMKSAQLYQLPLVKKDNFKLYKESVGIISPDQIQYEQQELIRKSEAYVPPQDDMIQDILNEKKHNIVIQPSINHHEGLNDEMPSPKFKTYQESFQEATNSQNQQMMSSQSPSRLQQYQKKHYRLNSQPQNDFSG